MSDRLHSPDPAAHQQVELASEDTHKLVLMQRSGIGRSDDIVGNSRWPLRRD